MKENPIHRSEKFFTENVGINKMLIIDEQFKLKGLVTASDIERIIEQNSSNVRMTLDEKYRLRVGATLYLPRDSSGVLDRKAIIAHAGALVDRGIDIVALSSAHAHTESMGEAIEMVRQEFPDLPIMAGNVTSARGVEFLASK